MKKNNWLLILTIVFSISSCEDPDQNLNLAIELSGTVDAPMLLEDHRDVGYDYYVTGKWALNADVTIMPGVSIMMKPESSILVNTNGSLNAVGAEVKPIIIEGEINTKGAWGEIEFDNSNTPKNVLDYVLISDGGGYGESNLWVRGSSRITIGNSSFNNSINYGIYASRDATLTDNGSNTFTGNAAGEIYYQQ